MSKELISVIMSTKDTDERFLRKSIESVLNQTYKNFEFIIVCDGGKKDDVIINSYDDKRIKMIKHEKSYGLTKSLNEMISISKGKYIARMDADDICILNRFEVEVRFLEEHPEIDIVSTFTKYIGERNDYNINCFYNSEGVKTQLFLYNNLAHPAVMIRKKFLDDNDILYDESFKYSQDYELWNRCCEIAKMYVIPKVCLNYRVHINQISTSKIEEQNMLCKQIYMLNLKRLNIDSTEKNMEYMFYLSEKKKCIASFDEMNDFAELIIKQNRITGVYNSKILKRIIYFNLFHIYCVKNRHLVPLSVLINARLLSFFIRKIFLQFKSKIFLNFSNR